MHTVQHHRLQYSFLPVSHLTWPRPPGQGEADHQAGSEKSRQKYTGRLNPVMCWISKAEGCQIMAVNDQGVKYKLQFSGCGHAKYLNSTNIPLEQLI